MKLKFELSTTQLAHINNEIAGNLPMLSVMQAKQERATCCLMGELAAKLLKKAIDKRDSASKFTLSLKYYEAYALHQFLLWYIDMETPESRRQSREILALLNQKLT